jgi:hypothetical protein
MFKQKIFDQKGKRKNQLGWQTTNVTKAIFVSDLKENFEMGLIKINCTETLEQMRIFVDNDGKTGNKRGEGNHDDNVIATALAIQGMKQAKWYV